MIQLLLILVLLLPLTAGAQVRLDGGTIITPFADVTVSSSAILVAAANAKRVAVSCTNTHASNHVRWGSNAVDATVGQRLPAGASIEIRAIGAVYMIAEAGDATVSCTEETTP